MARPGISFEQVAHAADALVGRSEKPTIANVRAEIGTGSPNTIHRHLQQWRDSQAPSQRKLATLPAEMADSLAQEIERQASAARAEAESEALDARQTANELAEIGEQLEAEADELRQEVETLIADRDRTTGERDAAQVELERLRDELGRERQGAKQVRQELAEARNRCVTLEEQRDEARVALADARQATKAAEERQVEAEKNEAVALAKLDSTKEQSNDRAKALEMEKQARRDDATAHKQALTELRDEWKERLTSVEKQAQEARQQAQEAEKGHIQERTRADALAARLEAFEARDTQTTKRRRAEEQPGLFEGDNPA